MADQIQLDAESPTGEETMYERMKRLGVNVDWYDKARGQIPDSTRQPIPLADEYCGLSSIYFLDKSGKLHTTTSSGEPHMMVRITPNKIPDPVFICVCCGLTFDTYTEALDHYQKKDEESIDKPNPTE